jgi:hypothetical protein
MQKIGRLSFCADVGALRLTGQQLLNVIQITVSGDGSGEVLWRDEQR